MGLAEQYRRLADALPLAGRQTSGEPTSRPRTHDYTRRYWGHDYQLIRVIDGGQQLRLGIFGRRFAVGDFLILQNRDGSTRYRITEITDHPMDPGDLWFVTAEFAPRSEGDC